MSSSTNLESSNSGTSNGGSRPSRYESQKSRDWNTFCHYLQNHRPPLALSLCSGAHVLEFLRYLDQFGKTKVHLSGCPFFGHPHPPSPCLCPLKQAWGSLDALVGRLRAAFEKNGGQPENNPFGNRAVRLYLREVRDSQAKARGVSYEKKKKRKKLPSQPPQDERLPPVLGPETAMPHGGWQMTDLNSSKAGYEIQVHEYFGMNSTGESGRKAGNSSTPVDMAEALRWRHN